MNATNNNATFVKTVANATAKVVSGTARVVVSSSAMMIQAATKSESYLVSKLTKENRESVENRRFEQTRRDMESINKMFSKKSAKISASVI